MRTESPWDRFSETVLVIGGDEPVEAEVHAGLGPSMRTRLKLLDLGDFFAVVTPCNPLGVTLDDQTSTERLIAFPFELDQLGTRSVEADGWSPDRTQVERGNACALRLPAAIALAHRWKQIVLFWLDGEVFGVIPVFAIGSRTDGLTL